MSVPILFCADDFAYADAVDAGIAELIERGRLTAASCLVASPRWPRAAARIRGLRERADFGLHLDFTEFAKLAPLARLWSSARLGLLRAPALRARIDAQLASFEDALGCRPDYVDGHQHAHQLAPIARVLIEALRERYEGDALPWVRVSLPAARDLKSRLIAATGARALARALDDAGIAHNHRLFGIYDFTAQPDYAVRLEKWLRDARAGDALMCHPARDAVAGDPLGEARVREFRALASDDTAALLRRIDVYAARGDCLRERRAA